MAGDGRRIHVAVVESGETEGANFGLSAIRQTRYNSSHVMALFNAKSASTPRMQEHKTVVYRLACAQVGLMWGSGHLYSVIKLMFSGKSLPRLSKPLR